MYEQTINFINALIPTKLETIVGGGVALVGVLMQHLFGAFSETFETLLILMTIDYITGCCMYKSEYATGQPKMWYRCIKKSRYPLIDIGNISN